MTEASLPHVDDILRRTVEMDASDLHLAPGLPPIARVYGDLVPLDDLPRLTPDDIRDLLFPVLKPYHREELESSWELDFSHSVPGVSRFRGNAMRQRSSLAVVFRLVPWEIPELDELGLPDVLKDLARLPRGLVLITGPTGSGKTTTLAGMTGLINNERSVNIITIEDPIEFLHTHKKAIIKQREVGSDTHSFVEALRHALRHDPDVILIGEMRDRDSIGIALTAAETGHLVLSTLHTQTAPLAVHRIIDSFPEAMRSQIRHQLAGSLQGVVAQQIIPRSDGDGRVVAAEVLMSTAAVRNMIREGKEHQIYSVMQTGRNSGMQTMDHALADLCRRGLIDRSVAVSHCVDKAELDRALNQGGGMMTL